MGGTRFGLLGGHGCPDRGGGACRCSAGPSSTTGRRPPPGESVGPMERLSWGRTAGLGAQHVVAMFGATFVFPLVMGLDPNLAILFSGICTILFLLIVQNHVPSYLGTSASFVASVDRDPGAGRRLGRRSPARSWSPALVLAAGRRARALRRGPADPRGAAAGRHRRRRDADRLQPGARRGRHLLAAGPVGRAGHGHVHGGRGRLLPGFWSRIAVFLALIFGYLLSWFCDALFGQINTPTGASAGKDVVHDRVSWAGVKAADWIGFPSGKLHGRRLRGARPALLAHLHPAGAARRDRADRGEHRPREGGRRDDQDRPRPLPGPRDRRGRPRDRAGQRVRWLADHDVRREHRRDGRDPGLLHGGVLRGRGGRDPARAVPEVRCASSARHRAVCSAGSPSSSTG